MSIRYVTIVPLIDERGKKTYASDVIYWNDEVMAVDCARSRARATPGVSIQVAHIVREFIGEAVQPKVIELTLPTKPVAPERV